MPHLSNITKNILRFFNDFTRPTYLHFKDKQEAELSHNRNKAFLIIHGLASSQYLTNLILGNGNYKANLYGAIGTCFIGLVLVFTLQLRLNPNVFSTIYNIYSFFFGFFQKNHEDSGIFGAWLAAPIFPIFVYFMTGSIKHFAVHAACQAILMNTFYQGLLKDSLAFNSVDQAVDALTHYSNESLSFSLMYTALTHFTLKNAVEKIQIAEKQKEDLERQRNFLLSFSHELRNLINSLMGNVKLASLEKLSDRVKDLLLNAEVCSELLLHLVNNILDTGKVEIGDLEINPVSTKIYDTIERIWGVCSELIKKNNLDAKVSIQKDIPPVLTFDHYRVTQIFFNLVGNAIKFTDSGHINIYIEWIPNQEKVDNKCFEPYPFDDLNDHDEGTFEKNQAFSVLHDNFASMNITRKKVDRRILEPRVHIRKGVLKVSVIDTGCGILKEDINKLFQRFQQGTSNPSKRKLGTGLGLFITRELCRRMNGDVKVFSKPGFGSVFTFCLPMEPVISEQIYSLDLDTMSRSARTTVKKLKAMVVDDEQFSQNILRDFLRMANVEVTDLAENGLIAYRKLVERISQKEYFDIITMDINMSIMDGKVAAEKIRQLEAEKDLDPCLLIMVSGNCGEAEIAECLDKNGKIRANMFLKKPVRLEELCSIVTNYHNKKFNLNPRRLHSCGNI